MKAEGWGEPEGLTGPSAADLHLGEGRGGGGWWRRWWGGLIGGERSRATGFLLGVKPRGGEGEAGRGRVAARWIYRQLSETGQKHPDNNFQQGNVGYWNPASH